MLTEEQKADIRYLIAFYDKRGADWSIALEYELRKMNGSLPKDEQPKRKERQLKGDLQMKW